ncbi:MAG TPA: CARDB domain-containing protein, partial [Bacteroidia bacterium]|nr:CARDB domain-containing protein [Bacteroidia bacterium]
YYNILNESSEINNSVATVINVVPNQPDIIPVGLGISNYYQCFQSEVVARIFNAGATATGNFSARLNVYYNNVLEFTSLQPVSSIQGRCTETVSFLFSPLNIGNYTFEVISDYDSIINESSEINNNLIVPYTFQQCFPDLKVYSCGSMDVKPTDPISPGTISLYAEIANEGQLTAIAPFVVNFNVAGINYPVTINSNLPAGDTILVSLTAATPAYGNNTLIVSADYANTVTESFEYNNDASAALCWDFATSNADCIGNPLNEVFQSACVPANIRVALYNFGLYEASQSEVKFEVSGPGIIGWLSLGTSVIFTDNTCICPYIVAAPGSFSYPQTGTYQIRITADPNGLYTECNETNNQIIFSVNVADIPDLTIYSQYIAPSLLNPQINQSITMNVTYKNIGCSAAPASELFVKVDNMPLDSVTAPALAANAFNTVAIGNSWSSFISGFHVIRAIIDNDNQIVEGGESNNEATRSVYVGHAPNFKATNLVVNEMYPQNGENVTL